MIKDILFKNRLDRTMLINSRLFLLRKMGFVKTDEVTSFTKRIAIISGVFINILRTLSINIFYFYTLYFIIKIISKDFNSYIFINMYIFLSVFGSLINSKVLKSSNTKYHSIVLLNMNCRSYVLSDIFSNLVFTFIFHLLSFLILSKILSISFSIILLLCIFMTLLKSLGEVFNLLYFKRFKNTFLSNTILYFLLLILLITGGVVLSIFKIYITKKVLIYLVLSLILPSIISIIYLVNFKDYKYFYKRLININKYKDTDLDREKYELFDIRDFNSPYSFINKVFIKRFSGIISSILYRNGIIITVLFITLILFSIYNPNINRVVGVFLIKYFMALYLVIFILNKTSYIVKILYNACDKSLSYYSFYNSREVINKLFIERVKSFTIINLVPIIPISILLPVLLHVTVNISVLSLILIFLVCIFLSITFTIHFLSMYYIISPFDRDSNVVDLKYQIINSILVIGLFLLLKVRVNINIFLISTIVISMLYSIGLIVFTLNNLKSIHK